MTKAELMKLAIAVSEADQRLTMWKMMNVPDDPEARLKQDAQYRIVQSAFWKAQTEYGDAIAKLSAVELDQILKENAP